MKDHGGRGRSHYDAPTEKMYPCNISMQPRKHNVFRENRDSTGESIDRYLSLSGGEMGKERETEMSWPYDVTVD